MRLALAAGEASGDALGASMANAMRAAIPEIALSGVCGPGMRAAGVEALADVEELNVMGLFEVLRHVPRLVGLRRRLQAGMIARRIDAFVGIDAPDFNLGLARGLKRAGVPTAQVVAPTVWAWRPWRARKVAASVDLLLTLLPFEPEYFRADGLDARFIGHPLADAMPMQPDRVAARGVLGLSEARTVVALLPGSRPGEIRRHAQLLAEVARRLYADGDVDLVLPLAGDPDLARFEQAAGAGFAGFSLRPVFGKTRQALAAADVAVAASGTVTLEALLSRTPMVVFYRLAESTYRLATALRLVRSRWISLPNILAGSELVPERIQHEATVERLVADVRDWLDDAKRRRRFVAEAERIHVELARGAAANAAAAITELARR